MALLNTVKNARKQMGLRSSRVVYGFSFNPPVEYDADALDRHINIVLGNQTVTNSWQMQVAVRDYSLGKRYRGKRERFIFESVDNEMLEARREVYIKDGYDNICFDEDNEPYQTVNYLQLANERPVTQEDCVYLYNVMSNALKRRMTNV
jgi:hypothetical protein